MSEAGQPGSNEMLLTIFLKHDQSQDLDSIQSKLAEKKWWERFPPDGVAIESWYVVMGIGQIATLRLPASKLAEVNVEIERLAWGVFATEFYPSYDFVPVRRRIAARYSEKEEKGET